MAYQNNNNRGGYGNQKSGSYQNTRGGGSFNRSGGQRGGNNGGDSHKYLRSSSFTKTIILDGENGKRERVNLEHGITEEIAVSMTAEKAQDFVKRIQDAINDQQGDGGIRMTMYCQHKVNQDTQEEFDGASILLVGKFPPKDGGQRRGGFSGGQQRGNGRRDYPDQGSGHMENQQNGNYQDANSGTQQSGQTNRGNQTQGSQQAGPTQSAQKAASPSEQEIVRDNYTEQSGW